MKLFAGNKTVRVIMDLYDRSMYFSELGKKGYSSLTLQKILRDLKEKKIVDFKSKKIARRGYPRDVYFLTEKGKKVAERLNNIDKIVDEDYTNYANLENLYGVVLEHVNVIDNVVRVQDGSRIADVYVREVHNKFKLKCDLCGSEKCVHVNFAYSLPEVRKLIEKRK